MNKRPLTFIVNKLVQCSNYPPSEFPMQSFKTASDYLEELTTQRFLHLKFQRNDAVGSRLPKEIHSPLSLPQNSTRDISGPHRLFFAKTFAHRMFSYLSQSSPSLKYWIGNTRMWPLLSSHTLHHGCYNYKAWRSGSRASMNF